MTIYLFKSTNKNKTTTYVNDKKPIFQIHSYHTKTQKNESYTQNWIKKTKQQNSKKNNIRIQIQFQMGKYNFNNRHINKIYYVLFK